MTREPTAVVLIVEDEPLVREIAEEEFADAGFRVIAVGDGEQALERLESEPKIDLLFTDIRLPGALDGWAIAREARSRRPELPVIYATGFSAGPADVVAGGILFKKPYKVSAIIAAAAGLTASS